MIRFTNTPIKTFQITNIWCSADATKETLGIDSGDCWMPICFDWRDVLAVKECGENEFLGEGRATIYIMGDHLTIEMMFEEAAQKFSESRA